MVIDAIPKMVIPVMSFIIVLFIRVISPSITHAIKIRVIKNSKNETSIVRCDRGLCKNEERKEILPLDEKISNLHTKVPCCNCSYSTFFGGSRPRLRLGLEPPKKVL